MHRGNDNPPLRPDLAFYLALSDLEAWLGSVADEAPGRRPSPPSAEAEDGPDRFRPAARPVSVG